MAETAEIQAWIRSHSGGATRLARFVSIAATIEPELLRAARIRFFTDLTVEAESQIWFSPLVESRSASNITFSNEAARLLWEGFTDKKYAKPAWDLICEFHKGISPAMEIEEELTYLALSDEQDVSQKIRTKLQSLVATLMRPEYSRLAAWAERALPRLPDTVRVAEGDLWKLATQTAYERGANLQGIVPGEIPAFVRRPTTATVSVGVRLFGRSVEFSYPPASDATPIDVPSGFPLRIRYAANEKFEGYGEVALWGTATIHGEIPRAGELYLNAVGGRSYRLVPRENPAGRPRVFLFGPDSTQKLRDFVVAKLRENRFEVNAKQDRLEHSDVVLYVTPDLGGGSELYDLAVRECFRIVLICPPGSPPDWMKAAGENTFVDFGDEAHWYNAVWELIAMLAAPVKLPASLERVPPAPLHFVLDAELKQAREALTGTTNYTVVQVVGPLGTGKTTLAIAIACDCTIRRRFDEVVWLTRDDPSFQPLQGVLLVCDFEPQPSVLNAWIGRSARVVITKETPAAGTGQVTADTFTVALGLLDPVRAMELWSSLAVDDKHAHSLSSESYNPLALRCWAMIGSGVSLPSGSDPVDAALYLFNADLWHPGPAILAPDVPLTNELAGELMAAMVESGRPILELETLAECGLASDVGDGRFTLHPAMERMDMRRLRPTVPVARQPDVAGLHRAVVEYYRAKNDDDWALTPDDGYVFQAIVRHLVGSHDEETLDRLLFDYDWIKTKLLHTGVSSTVNDLRRGAALKSQPSPAPSFLAQWISDYWQDSPSVLLAALVTDPTVLRSYPQIARLGRRAQSRLDLTRGEPRRRVLVIGTGGATVPHPVVWAAECAGREIARAGHGLISGGWPGVDHITCREYVRQLKRDGIKETGDRLRHVQPWNSTPDLWVLPEMYEQGVLDSAGSPEESALRSIQNADVVLLIGGGGATKWMAEMAFSHERPVIPIGSAGGDAEAIFRGPYPSINHALWSRLGDPIENRIQARHVILGAVEIIERLDQISTGAEDGIPREVTMATKKAVAKKPAKKTAKKK
jgi:APAF-1 helical domain/PhoH-like protein